MRFPNSYLDVPWFRLESLRDLFDILEPRDYAFSLDMVQGFYHRVNLSPSARTFCVFSWRGRYYVYAVLPFGLASAPRY